jgi:hypothetical protein
MATKQKVAVSERALIQRINRKLKPDYEQLKARRGMSMLTNVGRYYVLDLRRNFMRSRMLILNPWAARSASFSRGKNWLRSDPWQPNLIGLSRTGDIPTPAHIARKGRTTPSIPVRSGAMESRTASASGRP